MKNYKYHKSIDEWINLVETGKVEACKEQRQLIKLVKKELRRKDVWVDGDAIQEATDLIEKYFPFKLLPFQKFFYAAVTGIKYQDGTYVFDEFFFYGGRGAGKNGLASTLTFYLISDKNGVRDYDVDIVATSENQAKTSFKEVYSVIKSKPKLDKLFDTTKVEITYKKTNSTLRYCTSNAKTHDGGRPGAVIFDEVHEYLTYENINVHVGGLGKVDKPRRFYLTTDGYVREAVLDDLKEKSRRILSGEDEHNGFFPFIFKLDNEKEVDDMSKWEKANPRINYSPTLKKEMIKQYKDMVYNEELKVAFHTKRMNLPRENKNRSVATWEEIKKTNQLAPDLEGLECIGALDYAELKDFCAVGLLFKYQDKYVFKQHTFIHEESLKTTKFNINILEAVDLGLATIVKDVPIIPPKLIAQWFVKQAEHYSIRTVVADLCRYSSVKEAFEEEGMPLETIRSGYITHNKLHPLITRLFAENLLVFGDDKLMRWYVNNCFVKTDSKGNKSYHKIEPVKRKTDGFFAFIHAMSKEEELEAYSEYADDLSLEVFIYG